MPQQTTQSATSATPGKRYAPNPSVFGLLDVTFPARIADIVYTPPNNPVLDRFGLVIQFAQIHDIGAALIVQMTNQSNGNPFDISAASSLSIRILMPSGARKDFTAALYSGGTDGKLVYVTSADLEAETPTWDLDEVGVCFIQGFVTINSESLASEQVKFEVLPNIDEPAP